MQVTPQGGGRRAGSTSTAPWATRLLPPDSLSAQQPSLGQDCVNSLQNQAGPQKAQHSEPMGMGLQGHQAGKRVVGWPSGPGLQELQRGQLSPGASWAEDLSLCLPQAVKSKKHIPIHVTLATGESLTIMVDSASTSREVCLHIAHKQGLSDYLGFSLQVAVYDKVLARGPIHCPPSSYMQASANPCTMLA